jgi:hypothetical protein
MEVRLHEAHTTGKGPRSSVGKAAARTAWLVAGVGLGLAFGVAIGGLVWDGQLPWTGRDDLRRPDGVPVLGLELKFKHLLRLRERRAGWAGAGFRAAGTNVNVPATVRLDGRSMAAEVTLHGGGSARYGPAGLGRVRVKILHGDSVVGMRRFVIDDPKRPGLARDLLLQRALADAGLPHVRTAPVWVELDARTEGPAVLVEVPEPETVQGVARPALVLGFDPTPVAGTPTDAWTFLPPGHAAVRVAPLPIAPPDAERAGRAARALQAALADAEPLDSALDATATALALAHCELFDALGAFDWPELDFVLPAGTDKLVPLVRPPEPARGHTATESAWGARFATGRESERLQVARARVARDWSGTDHARAALARVRASALIVPVSALEAAVQAAKVRAMAMASADRYRQRVTP